jgi:hypothetical protein
VNNFDRVGSVEIGPKDGGTGFRIEKSRFRFTIDKNDQVEANRASVEIYNLSAESRNRIREIDDKVIIRAGYADAGGEEVLFTGQIVRVEHLYPSPDIITRIESGDGITELREKRSSASFAADAELEEIVRKLVEDFGLEIRDSADLPKTKYANGFSYVGPTREGLRKVLDRDKLTYSIQNGYLQIIERDGANRKQEVVLSARTGLLSSPARLDDVGGDLTGAKRNPGWSFSALLQPKVEPGGTVRLESREANGSFRVNSVRHTGDTHGREWYTEAQVSEIDQGGGGATGGGITVDTGGVL